MKHPTLRSILLPLVPLLAGACGANIDGSDSPQFRSDESVNAAAPVVASAAAAPAATQSFDGDSTSFWVLISWPDLASGSSIVKTGSIPITVQNTRNVATSVSLALTAAGLDNRGGVSLLSSVSLAANQTKTVSIPFSSIPVQSVGSTTQIEVYGTATASGQTASAVASPPVFANFASTYATATFYTGPALLAQAPGVTALTASQISSLALSLQSPRGRVKNALGQFVEVTTLTPNTTLGGTLMAGGGTGGFGGQMRALPLAPPIPDPPPDPRPKPPPPTSRSVKVCMTWPAHFLDTGFGEDYANASNQLQQIPARYAHAIITNGDWNNRIWEGYLDASGCAPYVRFQAGKYTAFLISEMVVPTPYGAPANFRVAYWDQWWSSPPDITTEMTATTFGVVGATTAATATLSFAVHDNVSRLAAGLSQVTAMPDAPILPADFSLFANKGCPSLANSNACVDAQGPNAAYFGDNAQGVHTSFNKYVVAHETGHMLQRVVTGAWWSGPIAPSTVAECTCAHVTSANKDHCLQSRDMGTAAQAEGFGHFIAAKTWNRSDQADCTFVYYKEFLLNGVSKPPPVPLSCMTPTKWMETHCPSPDTNVGVEYDWMTFYWNVNTQGTDKLSMADIMNLYNYACSGGTTQAVGQCNAIQANSDWATLAAHVQTLFPGLANDVKARKFIREGQLNGVAH